MNETPIFRHVAEGWLDVAQRGLIRDQIWFGGASIRDRAGARYRHAAMPGHETLVLRDAVLVPEPFAVIDRDGITRAGTPPSKPAERPIPCLSVMPLHRWLPAPPYRSVGFSEIRFRSHRCSERCSAKSALPDRH